MRGHPNLLRLVWESRSLFPPAAMRKLARQLANMCLKRGFDGLVLEVGAQPDSPLLPWVADVFRYFRKKDPRLTLVLVLPPQGFAAKDIVAMSAYVDRFAVMTYDFSSSQRLPGPVAPLRWVRSVMEKLAPADADVRRKLLLGINFYGYDNLEPVVGHALLSLLRDHSPTISWDAASEEHAFTYKDADGNAHFVHYPSMLSLHRRLQLAEELGVGLSIWEIGQGLEQFFGLL